MCTGLDPFSFLVISIAGWMNQRHQQVIEYLVEENRVLEETLIIPRFVKLLVFRKSPN
jgi:hypothetical protein